MELNNCANQGTLTEQVLEAPLINAVSPGKQLATFIYGSLFAS